MRSVATAAAIGLVIASASFGAVYGWNTGSEHGPLLGFITVLMAISLECCKPLALSGALSAFGALQLVRGVALAMLALVAIAYSLAAELTLMAGSRGDIVASRQAALNANAGADAEAKRAADRYDGAQRELAGMAPMRSAGEIAAEISGIDNMAGIVVRGVPCGGQATTKVRREWCPKRAKLMAEKARAERRAGLEAIIAKPLPVAVHTGARDVHAADPGASALAVYLKALGIVVQPSTLTEWLALVPVLALEVGSTFAALLVGPHAGPGPATKPAVAQVDQPGAVPAGPVRKRSRASKKDQQPTGPGPTSGPRSRSVAAVVQAIKDRAVQGSEREIAQALNVGKTTVNRAMRMLEAEGHFAEV